MNAFQLIAENKIREAMEKGEFDNLPGQGRPIDLSGDENLPPELRMAYRILKSAGYVQDEVAFHQQIQTVKDEAQRELENDPKSRTIAKLMKYKEAVIKSRSLAKFRK